MQLSETVLEVDRIIMPVHLGNHWTCATIDLAAKELVYYDSMGVNRPLHVPGSPLSHDRVIVSRFQVSASSAEVWSRQSAWTCTAAIDYFELERFKQRQTLSRISVRLSRGMACCVTGQTHGYHEGAKAVCLR